MFRLEPALPVQAMKTFQVTRPWATHWRPATCQEAGCAHYEQGWQTIVPADSPAAEYIRRGSGRKFAEQQTAEGLAAFTFEAGQPCFASDRHRIPVERPEIFTERGGDFRGNPRGEHRVHTADTWVDAFASHQDKLKTAFERG